MKEKWYGFARRFPLSSKKYHTSIIATTFGCLKVSVSLQLAFLKLGSNKKIGTICIQKDTRLKKFLQVGIFKLGNFIVFTYT